MRNPATDCTKCALHKSRTNVVWNRGNPFGAITLIGEAPGAKEDETGKAFVGRSGKKLDEILTKAKTFAQDVPLLPEEVLIVNTIKCRPPDNRVPTDDEIKKCRPYLKAQLELANPRILILLGKTASDTIIGGKDTLGEYRGHTYQCEFGSLVVPTIVTYHPAAVLRNSNYGKDVVTDIKAVIKLWRELIK